MNQYSSQANSGPARKTVDAQIRNTSRSDNITTPPTTVQQAIQVKDGHLSTTPYEGPVIHHILNMPADHDQYQQPVPSSSHTATALKRHSLIVGKNVSDDVAHPKKRQRSERTCWKCRRVDCIGKQYKAQCLNVCADCNNRSCSGRNSRYPTRLCPTKAASTENT